MGEHQTKIELIRGVEELGQILNRKPLGFRAPYFSLTADVPWAPWAISEAGFIYSSSVLPISNPQAGYPKAPKVPFKWSSGLIEFPAPIYGFGSLGYPVIGGGYLRVFPKVLIRAAKKNAQKTLGSWTYAHPYDFNSEEVVHITEETPWLVSRLIGVRRHLMFERIMEVVDPDARLLGDLASDELFVNSLEIWQ